MLYNDNKHITYEKRTPKVSLFCLLPIHHIIQNKLLGKITKQEEHIIHYIDTINYGAFCIWNRYCIYVM